MHEGTTDSAGHTDGETRIEVARSDVENVLSRFEVRVHDADGSTSEHDVIMSRADWERFGVGYRTPEALVEASFRFLLEHETKEEILGSFSLGEITRYFPSFPRDIAILA